MVVGKFIDNKHTFAVSYHIPKKLVSFYRLDNDVWNEIGHRCHEADFETEYGEMYFEELNGKPGLGIIMANYPPNMNNNQWMEVYCYSEEMDKIIPLLSII